MQCNAPNPVRVSDAQKLLRADRLHHQAEAALRRRLAEDPRDAGALLRLGDLHDFLFHDEREHLLSAALAMRGRFAPGGTGSGADRKVRPLGAPRFGGKAAFPCGRIRLARLVPKLREALPTVSMRLRIDGLDRRRMDLTMVAHPDGGFGTRHRDLSSSALAGLCYFHRDPRPFSGGDLLLYDTEVETGRCGASGFSRVEPAAGSIVFYPGHYVHEVTPVACGPGGFAAARLSVVVTFVPEAA